MSEILNKAIAAVTNGQQAFCHFIVANEVGTTGSHQCGFLIPRRVWPMFFDSPGQKGSNKDRVIRINWPDDLVTESRAIYYGVGTRNEYRLTRFGRNFPYLQEDNAGDLLVMVHVEDNEYEAHVLRSDEDIDGFLSYFDISPCQLGDLIGVPDISTEEKLLIGIEDILKSHSSFPITSDMSRLARELYNKIHRLSNNEIHKNQDKALLGWINTEFLLFKAFENKEFKEHSPLDLTDVQNLIDYAISLTNRRKSRAGKSLEHHLAYIFDIENLKYEEQVITEDNKKPDFIFPDGKSYHNLLFPSDGLTFLGAKTTCKDRWRQVLNEADRIPHKYLFTLQQGISVNQLKEMRNENLSLVVPKPYLSTFDAKFQKDILTLEQFIFNVREKQVKYYKD